MLGEGFVSTHSRMPSKEDASVIITASRKHSVFGQTSILEKAKRLLTLICELKASVESSKFNPKSCTEDLVDCVNEVKFILESNFEEVKLRNLQKFMLIQFAFVVLIYNSNDREDKKFMNTLKVVIEIIEQSNQIMINAIYDTMSPLEQASLSEQVNQFSII